MYLEELLEDPPTPRMGFATTFSERATVASTTSMVYGSYMTPKLPNAVFKMMLGAGRVFGRAKRSN